MKAKILNPIDTANLEYPDDVSRLAEKCHELMNLEFQKLKEEVQESNKCLPDANGTNKHNMNGHANLLTENGVTLDDKRRASWEETEAKPRAKHFDAISSFTN